MRSLFLLCGLAGSALPLAAGASNQKLCAEEPAGVGRRRQLLVDDYIISERLNVTRELGVATKANDGQPIITADRPWEDADLFRLGTVLHDGERFRIWYLMNDNLFGYAESEDGLNWTKPRLGLHEWQGNRDNNIVDGRGVSCFLDPHETDPEHKYKSAYGHPKKVMACVAHSPDGLHWTDYNNGEPVTHRAADTMNQILWDRDAEVYRLYTRTDYGQGRYAGTLDENRGTRDMVNPDLKADPTAWKTIREWKFDREGPWEFKRRQVYSLNGWTHEGVHFGLLWCYEWAGDLREGPYDLHRRHERDVMNFYLLVTRGDKPWDLTWVYAEKPLIPRGRDGSFDKDWVQPAGNIVTWQDKHWIYYCGSRERHDIYRCREGLSRWQCAIGLATLPLDRFVCLSARDAPGTVTTRPFELEGTRLEINADARNGELVVEVLDVGAEPLAGFARQDAVPLRGVDGLRLQPRWRHDATLAFTRGKFVRLRFHLRNAQLYAFQVLP